VSFDERYREGFSIGVGGLIVEDGKVLLARRAGRHDKGMWVLPGGFVERDESIEQAVLREVREETGLTGTVSGVVAVRSRVLEDENSLFVVVRIDEVEGRPRPACAEVDAVRFFSSAEIAELPSIGATARLLAEMALDGRLSVLPVHENPYLHDAGYALFA